LQPDGLAPKQNGRVMPCYLTSSQATTFLGMSFGLQVVNLNSRWCTTSAIQVNGLMPFQYQVHPDTLFDDYGWPSKAQALKCKPKNDHRRWLCHTSSYRLQGVSREIADKVGA